MHILVCDDDAAFAAQMDEYISAAAREENTSCISSPFSNQ